MISNLYNEIINNPDTVFWLEFLKFFRFFDLYQRNYYYLNQLGNFESLSFENPSHYNVTNLLYIKLDSFITIAFDIINYYDHYVFTKGCHSVQAN